MAFRSLKNTFLSFILLSTFLSQFTTVLAVTGYANAFVDPELIISKNLNASTTLAQRTMQQWASSLTDGAPWSMYFEHIYRAFLILLDPRTGRCYFQERSPTFWK